MTVDVLTLAEAQRIVREAVRNKEYQLTPLGMEAAAFLRAKRRSMADNSLLAYESTLDKLARFFPDLDLADLEPPIGTQRIEEFLDHYWGLSRPNTYNAHVKRLRAFFKWQVLRRNMRGDPMLLVEQARKGQTFRETYSRDQVRAIIAAQDVLRDRIACRLMLHYGIRRGGMIAIQFKHFDHVRRELTVFLKGGRVEALPIPERAFWLDLGRHLIDAEAQPDHFLMEARWSNRRSEKRRPSRPMSPAGFHKWWYRCLVKAEVVDQGVTAGERPHKARHTTGQLILDETSDLKLVQQTLKHTSIRTTADIYVNYENDQIAAKLRDVWGEGE